MSWTSDRARVASLSRSRSADDPELLDARRALKAKKLEEYVKTTVATAPKLTTEQIDKIATVFHRAAAGGGAA